ncbi:MAG: hypothetical protein U0228_39500 [Myxococcaceae bacterium]
MQRLLHASKPEPKFWAISVSGATITLRTGPMHTPGTTRTIECKSDEAALKTAEAMVEQRLRDGFTVASQAPDAPAAAIDEAAERALLTDDPAGWLVFADSLLETTERLRGELIGLQVRAARRERGTITKAKDFISTHFDALVGPKLAAWHKQVTIDWQYGYARVVKLWSGPHSAPLAAPLDALMQSPACRFLQRVEFGSPGNEGRYDTALRALVKLDWPRHLDALYLGNFDVEAAAEADSAWPRMESLAALTPKADRLRSLEVRAALNTFGKGLSFPKLERLALRPTAFDGRLMTDLLTLVAPRLHTFDVQCPTPSGGWAALRHVLQPWLAVGQLTTLVLRHDDGVMDLLESLGESLTKLEAVELVGSVHADEVARLRRLAPLLAQAKLTVVPSIATKLGKSFPKVVGEELPKPKRRPARRERYWSVYE